MAALPASRKKVRFRRRLCGSEVGIRAVGIDWEGGKREERVVRENEEETSSERVLT